ncbi:hypothetical protein [Modestobacter sp. SYSU DS0290]
MNARRLAAALPGAGRLRRIGHRFVRDRVEPDIAHLHDRLGAAQALLDEHERSRHEHWARIGAVAAEVAELRAAVDGLRFDVDRIAPALAGLEERVERLRQGDDTVSPVADVPAQEADDARRLLAQIRREHAQVRARLSTVAAYEERLRRLETH